MTDSPTGLRPRRPRASRGSRILTRSRASATGAVITALVVALAAPLGIAPAGAPSAAASWMTTEHTASAVVAPGKLAVTQSGFSAVAKTYSSSALTATAPITITNTGTIPAPYTLRLGAQAVTPLSQAVDVHVWAVSSSAGCTASTVASGPSATWSTVAALTGTLAPAAKAVYCVRTAVTQAQRFALSGESVAATSVVSAAQGSWTSTTTATASQSVAGTVTPGATTKVSETDSTISLTWAAPSDTSAVTGYQVYRGTTLVGTVPASRRQFTDTGLTVSTYYRYTVRAISSAAPGAASPESPAVLHATAWITSTSWYSIKNVANQLCVSGERGAYYAGEALVGTTCSPRADQLWKFVVDGPYLKVTPLSSSSLFWDSPSDHSAILRTASSVSAQKWEVVAIAPGSGTFLLRNRNNLCLDTAGGLTPRGHPALRVTECTSSTAQQFTLQKGA
ncbi:fibronectin type III domain-containing protein [Herbiconiux liukaitaii]|uniref:fibronectin type III domain-containing protein n=1 Tax=Herbiconiux liukaitaii TaxID=3342799 RepID=UPI0035BB919D